MCLPPRSGIFNYCDVYDVYDQFVQGHFTAQEVFSSIASDKNYEQLSQLMKGAVGITENPGVLLRWVVAGPEVTRLINELDYTQYAGRDSKHHEKTSCV